MHCRQLMFLILLLMSGLACAQTQQILWQKDFDEALATARKENKPVLICINMDNEVANDRMVKEHYRDSAVVAKSREFICLFTNKERHASGEETTCPRCGHISCDSHVRIEQKMRERYFESNDVVAPQHVFLRPDGKLLKTKLYFLTKAELLSLMDSVLRELFPERYKTPEKKDGAPAEKKEDHTGDEGEPGAAGEKEDEAEEEKPKTPADFKKLILESEELADIKEHARALVKMKEDPGAQAILAELLAEKKAPEVRVNGILLAYGFKGNKAGIAKIVPFLKHKKPEIRSHAAVALEDIAHADALKPLQARLKREKEARVRKNLVRAIGVTGKKSKKVEAKLLKLMRDKSALVQRNAAIALGNFKTGSKAEKELLKKAFQSGGGGRRGGGRQTDGQAALFALAQMGSKKAKEKVEEQIETANEFVAGLYELVLPAFENDFDPTNAETVRWRRRVASDRIARDLDPAQVPRGRENGRRGRRDRGGDNSHEPND